MPGRSNIIGKVQSLLAKSVLRGASEAEAEGALRVAQRLMLEHNLSMQDVKDHAGGTDDDWWLEKEIWHGKAKTWEQPYCIDICMKFFFVKAITVRKWESPYTDKRRAITYNFFGMESNVLLAGAVFRFLSHTFRELWGQYRKVSGASHGESRAFYAGLRDGLVHKLTKLREQDIRAIESDQPNVSINGGGLIRIEKIQDKLEQMFEAEYKGIKHEKRRADEHGPSAYRRGITEGAKIEIDVEADRRQREIKEKKSQCLT